MPPTINDQKPVFFSSYEDATAHIFTHLGRELRLATPLGLGKPPILLNHIFNAVAANPEKKLVIYTALSLTPPDIEEDMARRFFTPFAERHWGAYPQLRYQKTAVKNQLPKNIQVCEFYFQSGTALGSTDLQRNYQSVNYTHVAENVFRSEVNILVQLIARRGPQNKCSLSCNPDLTLDLVDLYRRRGKNLLVVGVVHQDLPFLEGESEVNDDFFDAIVDTGVKDHELFALPRESVQLTDYMIGLHASGLVDDGGTLQVGIGSLSEVIGAALIMRQNNNLEYVRLSGAAQKLSPWPSSLRPATSLFGEGLYGLSEMVTDVFMHLREAGILKREVIDEQSGLKTFLHGAFYLGSKDFYAWLRNLSRADQKGLRMTRVSKVNDLYDPHEITLRKQRVKARFFNTTMQMNLLGEAVSETLRDGQVVSGIGGQYNFVSMSHELEGARSILMLRSTYQSAGALKSNIVWASTGIISVPRHLRDIVVTEYGIADVKGRTDAEVILALLRVADSRFQLELLTQAKRAGKVAASAEIPVEYRNNFPSTLKGWRDRYGGTDFFKPFPFGSDFTPVEEALVLALAGLKRDANTSKLKIIFKAFRGLRSRPSLFANELERMQLARPSSLSEWMKQKILLGYLFVDSFK